MTVYVFIGPTLSPEEARAELDAVYLPPVSQGDVYRVSLKRPQAIGIIDGYFKRVPAVWHKEILWAMTQGIHVYGSASMGALRAVELAAFGMEGVGAIFEAYCNGTLVDDDEVAIIHGPAEIGYVTLSEAMVNIRRTLVTAEADGVLSPTTRTALERIAKALFYPERNYPMLLQRAVQQGLPVKELDAIRDWLPRGQVNQKREDALTMLRVMRRRLEANPEPKQVEFRFEYTEWWHRAKQLAGEMELCADTEADTILLDTLLDELRLQGNPYTSARQGAILRYLVLNEAQRQGIATNAEALKEAAGTFRRVRGLLQAEDFECWMFENHLNRNQFLRLMEEEVLLRWLDQSVEPEVAPHVANQLRVTGEYSRLLVRARNKQRTLEAKGLQNPDLAEIGLTEGELLRWYFEEHLGRSVVTDIARYARASGFTDEKVFRRTILREFCYIRITEGKNPSVQRH